MIKLLHSSWKNILTNPDKYIEDDVDTVLLQIQPINDSNKEIMIMVGRDEDDGRYYFVVEDQDVSEDIYVDDKTMLQDTFIELCEKELLTDELLTLLYNESVKVEANLIIRNDAGEVINLNQKAIDFLNMILEKVYLNEIAASIISNGYVKGIEVVDKELATQNLTKLLCEEFVRDNMIPVFDGDDKSITIEPEVAELIKQILAEGYLPFVARTTINAGYGKK